MRGHFLFIIFIIPLVFFAAIGMSQDSTEIITISTYYPAPYGVYKELRVTNTAGADIYLGEDKDRAGNPTIRLEDTDSTGGSGLKPSIALASSTTSVDFRIYLEDANNLRIQGGTTTFAQDGATNTTIPNYGAVKAGEFWICTGNTTTTY